MKINAISDRGAAGSHDRPEGSELAAILSGTLKPRGSQLFVALSVKSAALAVSRSLSSRAAQTLVLFMTSVLIAVLLVAPQPPAALGWELLAVAAVSGVALFILDRRAGHGSDRGVARYIERFSPNAITAVLVGVAGLTFLLKAGGGLYWLIPPRWRACLAAWSTRGCSSSRRPASPVERLLRRSLRKEVRAHPATIEHARSREGQ